MERSNSSSQIGVNLSTFALLRLCPYPRRWPFGVLMLNFPIFSKGIGFGVFFQKSTSFEALEKNPTSLCSAPVKFDAHSANGCT